jgi:hypothetical protein
MEPLDFPPNSDTSKQPPEDKGIERIISGEARRKKPSLGKQFKDTFIAGTMRSTVRYVALDVLLPMAKDTIVEVVEQGITRLIFGDSRRYRGSTPPPSGPTGYINYSRYSGPMGSGSRVPSSSRAMSRRARSSHDFDEIVLDSRAEAEEVIDRLYDLVSRYESASVADLYELVGLASSHTDHKWGWTDLRGAGVSRIRDGFLLDLPDPDPLD